MTDVKRPWWLLVNKPAGLITTVKEESHPGERVFIIHSEPMVQGVGLANVGSGGRGSGCASRGRPGAGPERQRTICGHPGPRHCRFPGLTCPGLGRHNGIA